MKRSTALGALGVLILMAIASKFPSERDSAHGAPMSAASISDIPPPPPPPEDNMTLDIHSWSVGGFGVVALVTLTINNANSLAVKDTTVRCEFFANSGTGVGTRNETIMEVVKGKSKKRVREFNFGFIDKQAKRMSCSILRAKWAD